VSSAPPSLVLRRLAITAAVVAAALLAYLLRSVLVPLFFAFLLAYALDPIVDKLERLRVPRAVGAPVVMLLLVGALVTIAFFAVPLLADEFAAASKQLPTQLASLREKAEAFLVARWGYRLPATWSELFAKYGAVLRENAPDSRSVAGAVFGTVNAIFLLLGTLVIPVLALYLLMDFDRIVSRAGTLVPRRWAPPVRDVAAEIHHTLARYVRGQILTNVILAALYATGLAIAGVRLGVAIGIMTGMLAFVPYVGLLLGTLLATTMTLLEWRSPGQLVLVLAVMATVGILDGMVITPRIVGGSVGLKPIEVLLTMMAAGALFGFVGVLLAVPLGAVVKIVVRRAVLAYTRSRFYQEPPTSAASEPDARDAA
jgi:predicted PurR-regulated permease PerM